MENSPFRNQKLFSHFWNNLCINNPGQSALIQMRHLPLKASKKHERGTDMEYTGYLGEADVEFQILSVLRSFDWKFGIDWLTEEIWFNTEMHLVIGYV